MVEKLYTFEQVMEMFQISRATLNRHVAAGLMKPLKLGRRVYFSEEELNRVIERMKQKGEQGD